MTKISQIFLTFIRGTLLKVNMKRYYFRHCGELHPINRDIVFDKNNRPHNYYPLIGCPLCRKICWLDQVTEIDEPDD